MAERLTKIVRNDFEHQRLLLMARRAKYRKYFVTRSPTGECLAQYKSGRAITRKSDINGEMAERLTKIVRNDFEHQRLLLMARRAKYRKYFVTRSPTGECLAQYKSGRAITRKSDINGEMAERLKALPC